MAKEVRGVDRQEDASMYEDNEINSDSDKDVHTDVPRMDRKRSYHGRVGPRNHGTDKADKSDKEGADSNKRFKLKCLNPSCTGEHPVKRCPKTPKEEAEMLLNDYIANRTKNWKKGQFSPLGTGLSSSAMFRRAFCDGAVETVAKADPGSDTNLIPPSVLKYIKASDGSIRESKPDAPQYYRTFIKGREQVICSHKLERDVMVHVRHGENIMRRKMQWLVSDCETDFVIIGEPVLRAFGLDNRALLEAACDKFGGTVDIPELLE